MGSGRLIYGIDVGTTKIVAIVGRSDGRRSVEVVSMGEAPSYGLRRGVIVDREAAAESVAEAIDACGGFTRNVHVGVGIAGSHIASHNAEVALLNRDRDRLVTDKFVSKLEAEVRRADLWRDDLQEEDGFEVGEQEVIHVVPRSFVLDGAEGVRQPVGLAARRVTMQAHVVTGAVASIQNLLFAVEDCGVNVSRVVLEPLASSEACLLPEDRETGVALLDVGGGTTDVAAFVRGALTHTAVVPIGGVSFSSDVAFGLKVPFEVADELKIRYGTVLSETVDSVAPVLLGERHYSARFIAEILEHRAREVLEIARDSLWKARVLDHLPGGVVLTGGGSQIEGMEGLAEEILGVRARVATPRHLRSEIKALRKPQYSTAVGLLYFAAKNGHLRPKSKGAATVSFGSIVAAVKGWFRGDSPDGTERGGR